MKKLIFYCTVLFMLSGSTPVWAQQPCGVSPLFALTVNGRVLTMQATEVGSGINHTWWWQRGQNIGLISNSGSSIRFIFPVTGLFRVLHAVTNGVCTDTSSLVADIDSAAPCVLDTNFRIRVRGYGVGFYPTFQSEFTYSIFTVWREDGTSAGNTSGHINLRAGRYFVQQRVVVANHQCADTSSRRAFVVDSVVPPTCAQLTSYRKVLQSNQLNVNILYPDTITRYTWDFGDGGPEVDGENRTHYYQRPGRYRVRLIAQGYLQYCDVSDTVEVQATPFISRLSGRIFLNGSSFSNDSVLVECISVDETTYQSQAMLVRNPYSFNVTANNRYLIYVTPVSGAALINYMPTYYGNTLGWTQNNFISAPILGRNGLNVDLIAANSQTGTGTGQIVAIVNGDSSSFRMAGHTMSRTYHNRNTRLLVFDNASLRVGFARHSANGQFRLNRGLPDGSYTVRPETPLMQSQTQRITITNGQLATAQYYVQSTGTITSNPTGNRPSLQGKILTLAPNPAHGNVRIGLSGHNNIEALRLTDALGRVQTHTAQGILELNLQLAPGVYSVEAVLKNTGVVDRQRLVIH